MRLATAFVLGGIACSAAVAVHSAEEPTLPAGWFRAGSNPDDYEMGIGPSGCRGGKSCAYIRGRGESPAPFGTLMQTSEARDYVGKRVRLGASVKAEGITSWAGLWMRVDGAPEAGTDMPRLLAFDNMQSRPIKGSLDWRRYEIVLDVPPEAKAIAFGILLSGPGRAWMEDLRLDTVGADVPVTDMMVKPKLPQRPNLKLER